MIEEQSSNELYEEQVLENEDLPDELQQQESTAENGITNNEIALTITTYLGRIYLLKWV